MTVALGRCPECKYVFRVSRHGRMARHRQPNVWLSVSCLGFGQPPLDIPESCTCSCHGDRP